MKDKIAVIGDEKIFYIFKALGMDFYSPKKEQFPEVLSEIIKKDYAILFIDEELAKDFLSEIKALREKFLPAISYLSRPKEELGISKQEIKELIKKAIGAEISL